MPPPRFVGDVEGLIGVGSTGVFPESGGCGECRVLEFSLSSTNTGPGGSLETDLLP